MLEVRYRSQHCSSRPKCPIHYDAIVDFRIAIWQPVDARMRAGLIRMVLTDGSTDQDLADLLRKKVKGMTEQQLVRTLIELALFPFGHSYKELLADNPSVLAAKRYGASVPKEKPAAQKKCSSLPKANSAKTEQTHETRKCFHCEGARNGGAA
jgi:hypothetical protein